MTEQGRLGAAVKILELNEGRDTSQFNIGLVTRALVTLQELNPELYEEWVDKIAVKLGTSQASIRNSVQGLVEADAAGTTERVTATDPTTGLSLGDLPEPPPAPAEDENLPPILGRVPDPDRLSLEPSPLQRQLGVTPGTLEPYRFGDHVDPFASLGGIRIRDLQLQLERAGLLEKGEYHISFWDIPTGNAMQLAMQFANEGGVTYQAMLTQLSLIQRSKSELGDPAPLSPDPASIAQDVKATFRQRLGREPSASELRELGAALGGFETQSLEQQAELATTGRLEPDFTDLEPSALQQQLGIAPGQVATPGTPTIVDPVARFLELFDKRFGPEEARNRRVFDTANQRRSVMSSLVTMQSLIEGG